MICGMLSETTWGVTVVYGISFLRERFSLTPGEASFLLIGTSLFYLMGSLLGGRLVGRVGRKRLAVLSNVLVGAFTLLYTNLGLLWASVATLLLACTSSSIRFTSSDSLVLEQIPELQGSVMSLYTVALDRGTVVGSAVGGCTLVYMGYSGLGYFGLLSLAAATLYHIYAVDPAPPG